MNFALPSLNDQRRIAEVLAAGEEAALAAHAYHQRVMDLRVSLLADQFGSSASEPRSYHALAA